jgi:hypothetical protein
MSTMLVWILVTVGGTNSNTPTYSPPMADLESCQRLQASTKLLIDGPWRTQCIQIRIAK